MNRRGIRGLILLSAILFVLAFPMCVSADSTELTENIEPEQSECVNELNNEPSVEEEQTCQEDMLAEQEESEEFCVVKKEDKKSIAIEFIKKANGNAVQIPVLTYHYLTTDARYKQIKERKSIVIGESKFESQMKYLSENGWRSISTEEFADWYDGKIELPKKSVLITFDDGSYSVIRYALPILEKYGMKACLFITGDTTKETTDRINNGWVGFDVIKEVTESYPQLEFQSHTYSMHNKINGTRAVYVYSQAQITEDVNKMSEIFGYNIVAYPWGSYNQKLLDALKDNDTYRNGFTYGTNDYATRSQGKYEIRRIKVSSTASDAEFKKWFANYMVL